MEVKDIPLTLLTTGEHAQRFDYADQAQEDLTHSIRKEGVLQPLIVRPLDHGYLIIDGHRRRQAAADLGLATLPCQIEPGDPQRARRIALITNTLRKDPSPIELAVTIAKAVEEGLQTEEQIAHALGRSTDWVKRQVALLQWPDDVLAAVHRGALSLAAAANLAPIEDDAYRQFLLDHAVNNGATARTTAAWLQQYEASRPMQQAVTAPPLPPGARPPAPIPTAPCLCCGIPHRTDELSHVPLCAPCITAVRQLGVTLSPPPRRPTAS